MSSLRPSVVATGIAAGLFALSAALVTTGAFGSLDQYAVDHWMHHLAPGGGSSSSFASELHPTFGSPLQVFCNLWTYPAAPVPASIVVLACCGVLFRRGLRRSAFAWAIAWLVANGVELVGKSVLERPMLHLGRVPLHTFDNSFPSGHTLRAVLAGVLVVTLWRRTLWPAVLWIVIAIAALVVNSAHTPSDVLGGVLVAALAVLCVQVSLQLEVRRSRIGLRPAVAEQR